MFGIPEGIAGIKHGHPVNKMIGFRITIKKAKRKQQ